MCLRDLFNTWNLTGFLALFARDDLVETTLDLDRLMGTQAYFKHYLQAIGWWIYGLSSPKVKDPPLKWNLSTWR